MLKYKIPQIVTLTLFYLLFATYLRQDKKVDNVELNSTYLY